MLANQNVKRSHHLTQSRDCKLTENDNRPKKHDLIDGPRKAKRHRISSSSSSSSSGSNSSSNSSSSSSSDDDCDKEDGEAQLTYQDWRDFIIKSYLNGVPPVKPITTQVPSKKPAEVSTNGLESRVTDNRDSATAHHNHQQSDQPKAFHQRIIAYTSTPKPVMNNEDSAKSVYMSPSCITPEKSSKPPEISRSISTKQLEASPQSSKTIATKAGSISITIASRTNGYSKTPEEADKPRSLTSLGCETNAGAVNNPFFRPGIAASKQQQPRPSQLLPPSTPVQRNSSVCQTNGMVDKTKDKVFVKDNVIIKEVKNNVNVPTSKTTESTSSNVKEDSPSPEKNSRRHEKEALNSSSKDRAANDPQASSRQSQQHSTNRRDVAVDQRDCSPIEIPICPPKMSPETFQQLNSNAKLNHVKSQLDSPSKKYIDKLISTFCMNQKEISKLKKEKYELIHAMKKVKKVLKSDTIEELLKSVDHKTKSEPK